MRQHDDAEEEQSVTTRLEICENSIRIRLPNLMEDPQTNAKPRMGIDIETNWLARVAEQIPNHDGHCRICINNNGRTVSIHAGQTMWTARNTQTQINE